MDGSTPEAPAPPEPEAAAEVVLVTLGSEDGVACSGESCRL
ncbi:hypothetical protein ABGB17_18690 [Sphaerisporangium sp. B11E5]